jgi:hypothetical protein
MSRHSGPGVVVGFLIGKCHACDAVVCETSCSRLQSPWSAECPLSGCRSWGANVTDGSQAAIPL